ncbi:conserved hypothetical protein [Burkholderiales bacterium]|nr:conserved hypothetical protein [Burkholderiales bacterium]
MPAFFSAAKEKCGNWSKAVSGFEPRMVVRATLFASVAALAICYWQSDSLPEPADLDPSLFAPPLQTATSQAPFFRKAGDITYKVIPLFEYDLYGLVVSEHDSHAFTDWTHKASYDNLNVIDLCVVWADDARSGVYRSMNFSSGNFTCNFQADDRETYARFDIYQISNNHLLIELPYLARRLRGVHVGDEVHFHGYLAEYEHDHGYHFHRGTSTTRFDTGNGACETVYVTDVQILNSHGMRWRIGGWLAGLCLVASVIAWLRLPAKLIR